MSEPDFDPEHVAVALDLTDVQALALAQFVKRLTWSEVRACAVDDAETETMMGAVVRLQRALDEAGYAPR